VSTPVVTVASGGRAVIDVSAIAPARGLPVSESPSGRGLAVTKAANGIGMPVVYDSINIVPPLAPTAWNPSDKLTTTLSNSNLTATATATSSGCRGVLGKTTGKAFCEFTWSVSANTLTYAGFALATTNLAMGLNATPGQCGVQRGGAVGINGSSVTAIGAMVAGDTVSMAVDLDAHVVWFRKAPSGNWNNSGTANPATGVGGLSISAIVGAVYPIFFGALANEAVTANFGGSAFVGAVPSGYPAGWG